MFTTLSSRSPNKKHMSQLRLLTRRRFIPLFATQFFGALNDNVFRFAIIVFVTFKLPESTVSDTKSLVAVTTAIFILPFFLISGIAGQIADKYEKSRIIRNLKNIEIILALLAGIGFYFQNFPALLIILFFMGTQSTFFGPIKYSLLPQHLKADDLTGANGLIQAGTYAAIIIGGFLGGIMIGTSQEKDLNLLIAMCIIACAGRFSAHFIPEAAANAADLKITLNPLVSGWNLIQTNLVRNETGTIIILISLFWFMGSAYFTLIPIYGKELLDATAANVSLLTLALAIGVGIGSVICEKISRQTIDLGLVSIAITLISIVSIEVYLLGERSAITQQCNTFPFFVIQCFDRFFIDMIILGVAGALYVIPLYAALQNRIDRTHRARTMAALNIMNAFFMVVSSLFTIALFHFEIATHYIFASVGILNGVVTLYASLYIPEIIWKNKKASY